MAYNKQLERTGGDLSHRSRVENLAGDIKQALERARDRPEHEPAAAHERQRAQGVVVQVDEVRHVSPPDLE